MRLTLHVSNVILYALTYIYVVMLLYTVNDI